MRLLRDYFWWKYERGSFHYDVMVTLILLFLFISPHYINYRDKPQPSETPRADVVRIWQQDSAHLVYEVPLAMLHDTSSDAATRASIEHALSPYASSVQIVRTSTIYDDRGHVVAFDATVQR